MAIFVLYNAIKKESFYLIEVKWFFYLKIFQIISVITDKIKVISVSIKNFLLMITLTTNIYDIKLVYPNTIHNIRKTVFIAWINVQGVNNFPFL